MELNPKKINPAQIFIEWQEEIKDSILKNNILAVAVFNCEGALLFANDAMKLLFGELEPSKSILNPGFPKLIDKTNSDGLVYNGYITIGDYSSINSSIMAWVYRKNKQILIIGGADSSQLIHQNMMMHNLNREVNNLQREIIKEKHNLEITLTQLNTLNSELSESNATKDKFFSIIAHDLKNPFTSLIGLSDYLIGNFETTDKQEIIEMLKMIHQSSTSTYSLLEDLLMWSKSQLGKIQFNPEKLYFSDIWNETIINLANTAKKKAIDIIPPYNMNTKVFCDKNMVKTILRNLISNAIKFSYPKSSIQVEIIQKNNHTSISVVDSGVGMDKDKQNKLWTMGNQISTSGTENESGSGLGLILCKEFTQLHKGEITVTSTPGKGSTFTFTLPKPN